MDQYLDQFIDSGYERLDNIALIMSSKYALKSVDIEKELKIENAIYLEN